MTARLRKNRRGGGGFTLIELLFTTLIFFLLFFMVWYFFRSGRRTMASTERKVDAARQTHIRFEHLRHDLECASFAWATPSEGADGIVGDDSAGPAGAKAGKKAKLGIGGGHILYAGRREYLFKPKESRLYVAGHKLPNPYKDVRFFGQPSCVIKFLLSADRAGSPATGKPAFRERSTLVSKVFVEAQAENLREHNHIWEDDHHWCVLGGSIHFAFTE